MGPFRFVHMHSGVPTLYLLVTCSTDGLAVDTARYHGTGPTPYPGLVDVVHQSLHGNLQNSSCHCLKGGDDVLFTFLFTQKGISVHKEMKSVKRSLIYFDDFSAKHTPCATLISFNMILNVYTCTCDIQCILRK